jgi:hypothetical protein
MTMKTLLCAKMQIEAGMSLARICSALVFVALFLFVPLLYAQSNSNPVGSNPSSSIIPAMQSQGRYTWVEEFDGSSNSSGQVMSLDSSVGYVLGSHLSADTGLPLYFVNPTVSSTTGTSTNGAFTALGDLYAQFRLTFPNPILNFKTQLTGRAPTGSTSDGISTGHFTYDWTNRVDRRLGAWTPFLELGLANSIPETFVYNRPFVSYGELGHFQLGALYTVREWLTLAASGFDVAPWGTQTITSRVDHGATGSVGHGPVFEQNSKTTGGSSLAADNGFSVGAVLVPSRTVDFLLGFSRSTHYQLNTISFGVSVNMAEILRPRVPS